MKKISAVIMMANLFATAGCGNTNKAAGAGAGAEQNGSEVLYQSVWNLVEVQGQTVPSSSTASLSFTPGKITTLSGNTGCNRMSGSIELSENNAIKFSPLATARMACLDENTGMIERKFTEALGQTTSWLVSENILLLKNGATILAKLAGQKPLTKEALQLNGAWELNYISGPRIAFDGLFPNKKPLIVFDLPKPEVTGNGGCNGYSCKVQVDGNKINFGDALSTMMACEGNGEPVFFKTLKTVTTYSISGNTLTMIMGDIAVMRFTKK